MRFIYSLLASVFLVGCTDDRDFYPEYDVPEDLQPFISSFINQAASRGVSLEITNLIIEYNEGLATPHCGQCNSNSLDPSIQKVITLNPNMQCWFSVEEQEALLFHELGHCILGRLHDEALLPNGDPKSMMVQNDIRVYAPCIYQIADEICNNTFKRTYYLDELFDAGAPVPEWGK